MSAIIIASNVSTSERHLDVDGEFTIRGVTRKVIFTVEGPRAPGKDPWGNANRDIRNCEDRAKILGLSGARRSRQAESSSETK